MIKPLPDAIKGENITTNLLWSYFKANQPQIEEIGIKLKYCKKEIMIDTIVKVENTSI